MSSWNDISGLGVPVTKLWWVCKPIAQLVCMHAISAKASAAWSASSLRVIFHSGSLSYACRATEVLFFVLLEAY